MGKIVSRKLTSDVNFEFSGDKERDIGRLKQEFGATVILPVYMYSHGGEVYGYELFDKAGKEIDSCRGIYGFDYVKEEVNSLIDWHVQQAAEEEKAQFALFVNAGLPIPERG